MDHAGDEDVRATEGVEHLQRAAHELLEAARSFLDVIEDVVDDPDRLRGATAGLSDLVATTLGRREAPWERSAWAPANEHPADSGPADSDPADSDTADDTVAAPSDGPAPPSRVRRIAVD